MAVRSAPHVAAGLVLGDVLAARLTSLESVSDRMEMGDLTVADVRPFVPTKDLEICRFFYRALGWSELWSDGELALLSLGGRQIVLQDRYVKEWAENFMLTVEVASADDWYSHVSDVLAAGAYGDSRVIEPQEEGWARVTYVWDPSGVLLHFAQFPKAP